MKSKRYVIMTIALIVALGGLLMGFDASVISGVNVFVGPEFNMSDLELGWSTSCLTLSAALAMLFAGPLSDRLGRRTVLKYAAIFYAISALTSAMAPNYTFFWIARMLGGFGVGASLILAPIYIAEMAPPHLRGRLVSFNQLNIVIGLSLAFFTNYLILQMGKDNGGLAQYLDLNANNWRWMLGLEAVPAVLYFMGLHFVPRSPRWLILNGELGEAKKVLIKLSSEDEANKAIEEIQKSEESKNKEKKSTFKDLWNPTLKFVLIIGIAIGILQQITGINSVFFYATMIFEQAGFGTDASFVQAIFIGLINLFFTILAILVIDKLGRKPLLSFGVSGIAIFMFLLAYSFNQATYKFSDEAVAYAAVEMSEVNFQSIIDVEYPSEIGFNAALNSVLNGLQLQSHKSAIIKSSITMNTTMVLIALLGFVASFAISLGPVMWVLFSELFPNHIRGIAISFVGLVNSAVSFLVQLVFPWELGVLGSDITYLIYGLFALAGLIFVIKVVPETKGKSLEELEAQLVR